MLLMGRKTLFRKFKAATLMLVIFRRVVAITAVIALVVNLLGIIPSTLANFYDQEPTQDNSLITASLDIESSVGEWSPVGSNVSLTPGYPTTNNIQIQNIGSLGFNYSIETSVTSGDLCANLNLLALLDNVQAYAGPVVDFNEGPFLFIQPEDWNLTFSLNSSDQIWENKSCQIKIAVKAWQEEAPGYSTDYFSDLAEIDLDVASGAWQVVPPTEVTSSDVVINEIMWMGSRRDTGSGISEDEWVELRNMTAASIDISGWVIDNTASSGGSLTIPAGSVIPANSYFVIANFNKSNSAIDVNVDWVTTSISLNNNYDDNGVIRLKSGAVVIDATSPAISDNWSAGKNESNQKWSMERNLIPGDGTLNASWHTCDINFMNDTEKALMRSYWDSNAQTKNCGTPGHANLSKNDPTADDYDPRLVISQLPKVLAEGLDGDIETLPKFPFGEYTDETELNNISEIVTEENNEVADDNESVTVDENIVEPVTEPVVEQPNEPVAADESGSEINNDATIPNAPEVPELIVPENNEPTPVDTQPEIDQNTEQPAGIVEPALTPQVSE